MLLRHLHLPGVVRYSRAAKVQDVLVKRLLAYKASPTTANHIPDPTLITAQFEPVYTCGRREVGSISKEQIKYLTEPTRLGHADFVEALRGGQTTFHGPGQLVAYPILDLKRHSLTPRDYVCVLEKSVIATCGHYGVKAKGTENPGVWVNDEEKICAVGVHLRRHITSHGIGLNVNTDLGWFQRIVACGLEGKKVTSLKEQGVGEELSIEGVADVFARAFAERLKGVDALVRVREGDEMRSR